MTAKICSLCHRPIPSGAPGGFCPACVLRGADETLSASPPGGPPIEEVRAAFPQLEVLALIGQGGMGFVYKARQPSLDRTVALKILAPSLGVDPAFAERFAREARVLGKLSHPNIVTVFEHGVTQPATPGAQPFYYLLMEYVDGVNLRQAMRAGRFTPEQALSVVPGICDALQAAHAQGIWHRDIKPENILLDARGGVKIADFGIARLVGDPARDFTITVTGAALGSAVYMAPEQHEKPHDVDHRADIYSLGVVIYEMLTAELPLGRFPAPSQRAAVDARIDEIVLRTLEKERSLRQQSAEEVKTDVSNAASSPPPARLAAARTWTPRVVSQMAVVAGIVLFSGAAGLTHGSTQNVLLTLSLVPFALGLLGLYYCRRHDTPRMQKHQFTRGLAAGALIAGLSVATVVIMENESTGRALAQARLAEERERKAVATAAAEQQRVTKIIRDRLAGEREKAAAEQEEVNKAAHSPPADQFPAVTARSVEAGLVLKMNAHANSGHSAEFIKGLGTRDPGWEESPDELNHLMSQFKGRITGIWHTVSRVRPHDYTGARGKRIGMGSAWRDDEVVLAIETQDPGGKSRYSLAAFRLSPSGPGYRKGAPEFLGRVLSTIEPASWVAAVRVEFIPAGGDPLELLMATKPLADARNNHSTGYGMAAKPVFKDAKPVPGMFELVGVPTHSPEAAAGSANQLAAGIDAILKTNGTVGFRIITPASPPDEPAFFTDAGREKVYRGPESHEE